MNRVLKKFDELTIHELYAIIRLRNEVFIVEQNCVYQDADNKDQQSYHLMIWQDEVLVAYTRILPPRVSYPEPSIGRVVVLPAARRNGLGRELMLQSLKATENLFGKQMIRLAAQLYLQGFYESLGFIRTGDPYLEDGIEHIEMIRTPSK